LEVGIVSNRKSAKFRWICNNVAYKPPVTVLKLSGKKTVPGEICC